MPQNPPAQSLAELANAQKARDEAARSQVTKQAEVEARRLGVVEANWDAVRENFQHIVINTDKKLEGSPVSADISMQIDQDEEVLGSIMVGIKRNYDRDSPERMHMIFARDGEIDLTWGIPKTKVSAPKDLRGDTISPTVVEAVIAQFLAACLID